MIIKRSRKEKHFQSITKLYWWRKPSSNTNDKIVNTFGGELAEQTLFNRERPRDSSSVQNDNNNALMKLEDLDFKMVYSALLS